MGRFFKTIGRFINMCFAYMTFGLLSKTEGMEMSEAGVSATYDEVRSDHTRSMKQSIKGVAITTRMKNTLQARIESITEELTKLRKQRSGAEALLKKRVKTVGKEKIREDADFQKFSNLYNRADELITSKETEVEELHVELEQLLDELEDQERELAELSAEGREIDKEEGQIQADLAHSKSKKELAEARAGIATGGANEARQRIKKLRDQSKAEAEAASRVAGATNDDEMKELERYAAKAASNDKLDALLGLSEETETATSVATEESLVDEKFPE
ncbi:MAG: hypothetical protein ACW99G_02570 [Candidatus Thorarchaeota archaeon]